MLSINNTSINFVNLLSIMSFPLKLILSKNLECSLIIKTLVSELLFIVYISETVLCNIASTCNVPGIIG